MPDSRAHVPREPEGIRTPDPRLRRPLLYPAELQTQSVSALLSGEMPENRRAGDGNRTHVSSLEGWCSTIEPHLRLRYISTVCPALSSFISVRETFKKWLKSRLPGRFSASLPSHDCRVLARGDLLVLFEAFPEVARILEADFAGDLRNEWNIITRLVNIGSGFRM